MCASTMVPWHRSRATTADLVRSHPPHQRHPYARRRRRRSAGARTAERAVLWRHALRNALLPLVTLVGLDLPALLGGSVVVETVFAWPGVGRLAVDAVFARDYPVVLAVTACSGVAVVLGNQLADLIYGRVDPRVRLDGERPR